MLFTLENSKVLLQQTLYPFILLACSIFSGIYPARSLFHPLPLCLCPSLDLHRLVNERTRGLHSHTVMELQQIFAYELQHFDIFGIRQWFIW